MSNRLLATLATYVPTPIAYQIAAAPQLILQPQAHRLEAAVLFLDLCGFTALADQLGESDAGGAKELAEILNTFFERMIMLLEMYGGQVVKFSGDALTVLFPCVSPHAPATDAAQTTLAVVTLRAVQSASQMLTSMRSFKASMRAKGHAGLDLKVSIAAGDVLAMQVGGVFGRWEYVIAGDAMVQLAIAAHHTAPGQIVLSDAAHSVVGNALEAMPTEAGCWQVHAATPVANASLQPIKWSALSAQDYPTAEAALRAYIPAAVTTQLNERERIAELRPMHVLFAGIGGFDYSAPDTERRLHRFVTAAQEAVYRYEGALNKVAVDDKGTVLLALFGAPPLIHEDDAVRALACAHDLQEIARTHQLRMAIGLTAGTVFSGTVGGSGRSEYTVIGDTVNLAARLMQAAGAGNTLCDEAIARAAEAAWSSDALPPVQVKGKPRPVAVYRPRSPQLQRASPLAEPFVGRQRELMTVLHELSAMQGGESRLVVVSGAAGSGKTRLVQQAQRLFQHCDLRLLSSSTLPDQEATTYLAWRDLLGSAFNVQSMTYGVRRKQVIADRVLAIYPQFHERLPLLNDIHSLDLPESAFTTSLSAAQRHQELASLLVTIMRDRAAGHPLLLVLEDMHYADAASWELLLDSVRHFAEQPVLIVLTMRPTGTLAALDALCELLPCRTVTLGGFDVEATRALIAHRLDLHSVPHTLIEHLMEQTGGNPGLIERALRQHHAYRHQPALLQERVVS